MARLRTATPYAPREQTTRTLQECNGLDENGEPECPAITLTSPDTEGNTILAMETQWLHDSHRNGSARREKSPARLPIPPRSYTRKERRKEGKNAPWLRKPRSYLERLSQSQPPPVARSSMPGAGDREENDEVESMRATSMPPAEMEVSEEDSEEGGVPISPVLPTDQESVERGRRTARGVRLVVDSSADSDSWKRRGRSRGPRSRPAPGMGGLQGDEEASGGGAEQGEQRLATAEAQEGGVKLTGAERSTGWVPAEEPESEK
ncbi:hypothetical protein PRZ48_003911 [Zasmidium cellare]|uniref:Uncharacterized protein n=1 Tax=Zasmidium cellare TaxID=395010 RepID=A0ABR0EXQ9_ZASCE|nr:hypothetical protein PRZ48_003911 [Zasmidium cellare]